MPWIERTLRGKKVLARCDEGGALRLEEGRVEVRYRATDSKAYRAYAANLEPIAGASVLADDHCVAASADGAPTTTSKPAGKAKVPKVIETEPAGSDDLLRVYADGACSGNPGPAGLGVVIYSDRGADELSEYLGHATNNIAELTAILRVAERLAGEKRPILLKTDSQYSIGVLTKGWKAKANPELIANVKLALAKVPSLRLAYIEGHAGHAGNERADELARAAVSSRASAGWSTRRRLV